MTNSQPRASRPSAIRRRPQPVPSVDEFIQAGASSEPTTVEPAPTVVDTPQPLSHHRKEIPQGDTLPSYQGEGKTYIALFLGICALGVSLFALYHSAWGPLRAMLHGVVVEKPHTPERVSPAVNLTAPVAAVETPTPETPAIKGMQWIAITNLQFARHDLLLGLNTAARDSLILAKVNLGLLGEPLSTEAVTVDRIIANLDNASVLSLGQLDSEIEALKENWRRVTFSPVRQKNRLWDWLFSSSNVPQKQYSELETTEEGRHLVAHLDRLKWLALWGDEQGFRQASTALESMLGTQFLKSSDAEPWLLWLRKLQRMPLRHDVTELTTLIVRLSRWEASS